MGNSGKDAPNNQRKKVRAGQILLFIIALLVIPAIMQTRASRLPSYLISTDRATADNSPLESKSKI